MYSAQNMKSNISDVCEDAIISLQLNAVFAYETIVCNS